MYVITSQKSTTTFEPGFIIKLYSTINVKFDKFDFAEELNAFQTYHMWQKSQIHSIGHQPKFRIIVIIQQLYL